MSAASRFKFWLARGALKAASFAVVPAWVRESILEPSFRSLVREGYRKNAAFFACVSALAFAFPEPPLQVRDHDGDDGKVLPKHPLRKLLKRPNPRMGEDRLWLTTMVYMAIGGNAYWHKVRAKSGEVIELWPYHAGQIRAVPGGDTWIKGYEFDNGTGTWTPIPAQDIVHFQWPTPDPEQPWQALPPLAAAAGDVDAANEITRYVFALLKNDAVPRTIITSPSERFLTQEEYDRTKNNFKEKYGGDNRGDVAIIEGGAKIDRLALNLTEMAADTLFTIPEVHIAAVMRVPAILAGLNAGLQRSTFANFGEARKAFTQDTLVPLWAIAASTVQASLGNEWGDDVACAFDLTRVAALQEQTNEKWARVNRAYVSQILWLNESRRMLGVPDVPDGNRFYQPNTRVATAAVEQGKAADPRGERKAATLETMEKRLTRVAQAYLAEQYAKAVKAVEQ